MGFVSYIQVRKKLKEIIHILKRGMFYSQKGDMLSARYCYRDALAKRDRIFGSLSRRYGASIGQKWLNRTHHDFIELKHLVNL